ncbi:MAG TPA: ABC transporter permease subunit [Candidatus Saccharimonadales bacterium]|nr:ABC transporter permease subunit [Candidatus Saccharimonadales bacterium]
MKATFEKIRAIAYNTTRETIRDKLLYSLIAFAVLVIAGSLLAGSVSLGQDVRVIESFGLTATLVFLLIITIFIGTQLVWREVERKTIYMALSKPVSREAFYLGKFFGLALTVAISAIMMGMIFLILIAVKTHGLNVSALWAVLFIILEAWLLIAAGLMFSSFTSPIASAIYTFCLVLIGHSSSTVWSVAQKSRLVIKAPLEFVYYIFPNLEKFNLRNEVVYNFHPSATQVLAVLLYFVAYTTFLLLLGLAIFRRDEF